MLLYVLLISHTEDTPSDSVDADDTMLDYYSVVDEALVVGTTYYKIKKNSATTKHLSKMDNLKRNYTVYH